MNDVELPAVDRRCFVEQERATMEHIAAVLLLLGCSDDMATCREIPTEVAIYESAEECEAMMPDALAAQNGMFPQVMGKCVGVDPALEDENAELVWNVQPNGTLFAAVEVPDVMVAADETEVGTLVGQQ